LLHQQLDSESGLNRAISQEHSSSTRRRASSRTAPRAINNRRQRGQSQSGLENIDHPSITQSRIIERGSAVESSPSYSASESSDIEEVSNENDETQPLLAGKPKPKYSNGSKPAVTKSQSNTKHSSHKHRAPKVESAGGHSHGDLNMRGVFLHVMGDALGNIGVIATALFIWLTDFSWRFYADPLISLIITVIILCSALPLCYAASRILLQAVPADLSIDDLKADIEELDGILSCYHVHVWQLSGTKLIASLHIQLDHNIGEGAKGKEAWMQLQREVRTCLREYGISSSTIQPEFCLDDTHNHVKGSESNEDGTRNGNHNESNGSTGTSSPTKPRSTNACLPIDDVDTACCPPDTPSKP
jgi:solute carrier family 30 (zinc transporter), member 1